MLELSFSDVLRMHAPLTSAVFFCFYSGWGTHAKTEVHTFCRKRSDQEKKYQRPQVRS